MARDYFAVLGLTPGTYTSGKIAASFFARREELLRQIRSTTTNAAARQELDELYLSFSTLRDPERQEDYRRSLEQGNDHLAELQTLIAASLEDGLLRHSRRQRILERAAELGISEFHAHLMIAQEQFGDAPIPMSKVLVSRVRRPRGRPRAWPRVAATGALALAMFLYLVHWAGS